MIPSNIGGLGTISPDFLKDLLEEVAKIRRDYPTPPVRWEMAQDVYDALRAEVPAAITPAGTVGILSGFDTGTPVIVRPDMRPGEWGPVFRTRTLGRKSIF